MTGPSHAASFTLHADGSYDYTADPELQRDRQLHLPANDGTADSNMATVTITVNSVNDAPVATDDIGLARTRTRPGDPPAGLLANDTDVDGDALTGRVASRSGALGAASALNADGSFTYTPAANFNGTDSFTYTANDGTADSNRRR